MKSASQRSFGYKKEQVNSIMSFIEECNKEVKYYRHSFIEF